MVEVISAIAEDGSMIPNDIRQGVWVVVKATSDYVKNCFEEYMVSTDDSGLYYCNFKRFHLIGLELGLSVGAVGVRGEATGASKEFRSDVVAVSKKDMRAGEMLDGEGGYCVAGQLRPSRIRCQCAPLPLGLTGDIKLIRDVAVDTILTYDDVEIDESLNAVKLRREWRRWCSLRLSHVAIVKSVEVRSIRTAVMPALCAFAAQGWACSGNVRRRPHRSFQIKGY